MDKIKAVLESIVTYLTLVMVVLTIVANEIGEAFADGTGATVIAWIVRIGVWITLLVNIISRVTPVLPSQRGLVLPPGAPQDLLIKSPK